MNFVLARVISTAVGYVFGLIETGALLAKSKNIDLRKEGSGNIGSTNSLRVLGVKAGFITLAGDMAKCALAMVLIYFLFRNMFPAPDNGYRLLMLYAGIGAILGHDYPFYHKFKGGKGVACVGGMLFAFAPLIATMALLIFIIVVAITKYVSLGSMIAEISIVILAVLFGSRGYFVKLSGAYFTEAIVLLSCVALLCVFQHRANILRLIRKEEHKLSFKKAGKTDPSNEE